MKRHIFFLFLTILLCLGVAFPEQWYEKKPYLDWSPKDVKKILENSGWTKVQTVTISNSTPANTRSFESTGAGDLQREMQNHFRIRFLTAMPIRMAIARSLMLKNQDKMTPQRLAGMDRFVRQSDDLNIIVLMTLNSTPAGSVSARDYWTSLLSLRTSNLTSNTFLATSGGKKAYLTRYEPPGKDGLGAKFFFPRLLKDGTPLVTLQDKEIRFQTTLENLRQTFGAGNVDGSSDFGEGPGLTAREDRIWTVFKVKKMVFEGKLEI